MESIDAPRKLLQARRYAGADANLTLHRYDGEAYANKIRNRTSAQTEFLLDRSRRHALK